jgi:hypothetical protein
MKALAAGKHVLVEKPAANTAEETRAMFELAERKGLVLMEAMHTRYPFPVSITSELDPIVPSDSIQQFKKSERYSTAGNWVLSRV